MNKILTSLFFLIIFFESRGQQKAEQNIAANYLIYLPQDYHSDTTRQWPLMIFLHGSGESGTDLEKVKKHGPPKLIEQGKQFPFIVISPQAPSEEKGWEPDTVISLLKALLKQYKIDRNRIYLTGLSMGGFGTWSTAMKYPWLFAAIVPICGGGDTADIMKLKHMPVWCFHGAKDSSVNPEESYRMIGSLKKFNPDAKLTVYPEAGHDSWTVTYNNDSLYSWLLQQKRYHFPRVALTGKQLNEYAGGYVQEGKDTIHLVVKDGKLLVKEKPLTEIIPGTNNSFFAVTDDKETEIKFRRNVKGKIEKMLYLDDKIIEFERVK